MKTNKELHDEDQFEAMRQKCLAIVQNRIKELSDEGTTMKPQPEDRIGIRWSAWLGVAFLCDLLHLHILDVTNDAARQRATIRCLRCGIRTEIRDGKSWRYGKRGNLKAVV